MRRDFSHTTNFVGIDPVGWPSLAVKDANDVSISAAGEGNGGISTHADAAKKTSAAPIDAVERRDMDPNDEVEQRAAAPMSNEHSLSQSSIPSKCALSMLPQYNLAPFLEAPLRFRPTHLAGRNTKQLGRSRRRFAGQRYLSNRHSELAETYAVRRPNQFSAD
jgi:hypothetical protein